MFRAHADVSAVDGAALRVGRNDEGRRAVAVDVVGAVLGVVLDNEDRHFVPEFALAEGFDDEAEGVVVVGHIRQRGDLAGGESAGVIVTEANHGEVGELAFGFHTSEVGKEYFRAIDVRVVHVEAPVVAVGVRNQGGVAEGLHVGRGGGDVFQRRVFDVVAVVAQGETFGEDVVPDMSGGR